MQKPRILVVDDEEVICDILQDFLEFEGFWVKTANCGEDAYTLYRADSFDLVLTDLKMPGIDGLELLARVQELDRDAMTVIMTGFGTVETAIDAMKRGAFDYILKPFKPEEVVRVLRRALEKQSLERENVTLRQLVGFYELSEAMSSTMPLSQQLARIGHLVRENFDADGVSILVKSREEKGHFSRRLCLGDEGADLNLPQLLSRFQKDGLVLANGDEVHQWLANPGPTGIPIRSLMSVPLKVRGMPFGVLSAHSVKPTQRFSEGQRKGLAILADRAANAIENARMYENLQVTVTQTMEGFARALEAKDPYTHGHSDRVSTYARLIATAMGLPPEDVDRLSHGGLMHDIGKIGIRATDLNKIGKLTPEEYLMFKSHPVQGQRIIEPIGFLAHLVPAVLFHHEAWDGTGYPNGLEGTDIPLDARIMAVADSYDAMTSNRPYRKALPHDIAVMEFKRCAGRQFDREAVSAFLDVIEDFRGERQRNGHFVPS